MSVGELALSNYTLRVDGARASVRPHARRVRVTLPAGVEQLLVSAPGDALAPSPLTGWTADGVGGELTFADALPVQGTPVTVRLRGRADVESDDGRTSRLAGLATRSARGRRGP